MNSTDRTRSQYSGGRRPTNEAKTAPATPAKNDEMANADQLVLDLGHAHDLGGDVAVADRLQRPPRPGAHEVLGDQEPDDHQAEAEQVRLGVAADVEPQPVAVLGEGDERLVLLPELQLERREVASDLGRPGDLGEEAGEVDADEDQSDGEDAEVQPAHTDRGGRDEETDQRGADAGARQPDPHRQLMAPRVGTRLTAEVGGRVRADTHEEGVAE